MRAVPGFLAIVLAITGAAVAERPLFTGNECADFGDGYDRYGPTDLNGAIGHGRLTVGVNHEGTISVLKWPNTSFYDHVKYFTFDREDDPEDARWDRYRRREVNFGVLENEGIFAGLMLSMRDGSRRTDWLRASSRGWRAAQRYLSPDADTLVTRWDNVALGLRVTGTDVVPPIRESDRDVLVRRYVAERLPGSRVRSASLVAFANLNPVASKAPLFPAYDWCQEGSTNDLRSTGYEVDHDAVLWSRRGNDDSVAIAMGLRDRSSQHQVGSDALEPASPGRIVGSSPDAYLDSADGRLSGNDGAAGPSTAALATPLRFSGGRAIADVLLAFSSEPAAALDTLDSARTTPYSRALAASNTFWRRFLSRAPVPAVERDPALAPAERRSLIAAAKRSLVSLRMMVTGRGPIVAGFTTQPPYGEDWIRDGAFFNEALDLAGHPELVTRHNLFYASVQTGAPGVVPLLPRPPGNWASNYYADGTEGQPIAWEIDETGLGAWTLWAHARHLSEIEDPGVRRYAAAVYPAIARAADWLTTCEDPRTGLLCPQTEDDAFFGSGVYGTSLSQTRQGAAAAVAGLRAAVEAGRFMRDSRADRWRERLTRLIAAIDRPERAGVAGPDGGYWAGRSWGGGFDDGGWLIWPGRLHPYADPRMREQARYVAARIDAVIAHPTPIGSQYEGKGTLALAHFASEAGDSRLLARVRRQLVWLATYVPTPETGLFGEHYYNACRIRPIRDACPPGARRSVPTTGIPHAWQHTLFYLSALAAWAPGS